MRLKIVESRDDSLKAKMYFIQKIEELVKKYGMPDELNFEVFDGEYSNMGPDHFYRMPIPALKSISERMEKYFDKSGLEIEESLKESYSEGTMYQLKKGADLTKLGEFLDNVFDYVLAAADDMVILPWDADLVVLGNSQVEIRGLALSGGVRGMKAVVTCDADKFRDFYRIVFNESPEEIDEELFNELFEKA